MESLLVILLSPSVKYQGSTSGHERFLPRILEFSTW
jgi:hypothetical protein